MLENHHKRSLSKPNNSQNTHGINATLRLLN